MSDPSSPAPPAADFWGRALAWAGAHKKTLVIVACALGGLIIGLLL